MEDDNKLLYCSYAIATFDLLCCVLFTVLCLCLIFSHLSWLTIFGICFGLFWLTLIILLINGIHARNRQLVRYWLMFSCFGIFVEFLLIIYAFLSNTAFQSGVVKNCFILCLGLIVETVFAFTIYQFYLALSACKECNCGGEEGIKDYSAQQTSEFCGCGSQTRRAYEFNNF